MTYCLALIFDKNWCNHGCRTRLNPNKTWSKDQCVGVAIYYGKYITKNEPIYNDEGCYYYLGNTCISDDSNIID
jgi:hypothetical protein